MTEIIKMPDAEGSGDIVEMCFQPGDQINAGDSVLVLESDKASMEVPAEVSGVLVEWLVAMGDSVSSGMPLAKIEPVAAAAPQIATDSAASPDATQVEKPIEQTAPAASVEQIVAMPDAGGSGDVIEFYKQPGEHFDEGEALLLVESDKAAMEVPAPFSGQVVELLAAIGDTVSEGVPLIKALSVTTGVAAEQSVKESAPAPVAPAVASTLPSATAGAAAMVYAGPAVRKLARELGVDLTKVTGTGNRQRVLKDDVKRFVKQQMQQPVVAAVQGSGIPAIPEQDFTRFGEVVPEALSGIARATSEHMTRCWLNIPHVTLFDEVVISELEAYRKSIRPELHGLDKAPSLLPFIVLVVAKALRQFPRFNASLSADGMTLLQKRYVNIGVAVDTPAGLVVPVIRDADKKSVVELTQTIQQLADKARARKLKPEDMQGGCFTISSLGAMGGTGFTPIINAPEVAILGVSRTAIKPVWDGHAFQPGLHLPLSLSFDHRVINGGDAGRFMAMLNSCLTQIQNVLL